MNDIKVKNDGEVKPYAELSDFKVIELDSLRIIGKEIKCIMHHPKGNPIPAFWGKCCEDGTAKRLSEVPERIYKNAMVGWCGNYNCETKTFSYIVGILAKKDAMAPEGMISIDIHRSRYAVGTMKGTEPDIYMKAHELTEREYKKQGYRDSESLCFEFEWYDERFCDSRDIKIIDLYMPIE